MGLFDLLGQPGEGVRGNGVVAVQAEKIVSPGGGDARVPGGAQAAVGLVDYPDQPGVFGPVLVAEGGTLPVGGPVVHQDDLPVAALLAEQGVHALGKVVGDVVDGNDNTE